MNIKTYEHFGAPSWMALTNACDSVFPGQDCVAFVTPWTWLAFRADCGQWPEDGVLKSFRASPTGLSQLWVVVDASLKSQYRIVPRADVEMFRPKPEAAVCVVTGVCEP